MYFYLLAIKTYYYLLFIIWNRWRSYSEGKIHMSEPESGNGNVSTVYFVNQAQSLFTMNGHAITNVYLDLSFLFRIMFVKNILLQISFCAWTLQVNVRMFSRKFESWCNYVSPTKLVSLRKLARPAPSRNVVCTGTSSIRMAWTLSVKYLCVKPRLLMK